MLIPFRLPLYEDELLYSWFLRMQNANLPDAFQTFYKEYFRPDQVNSRNFLYPDTSMLDDFQTICSILGKNDQLAFFLDTTIYPLYRLFLPWQRQAQIARYVFAGDDTNRRKILNDPMITTLKLCPACQKEDRNFLLHRFHHLPEVNVCVKHGIPLHEYHGKRGNELTDTESWKEMEVQEGDYEYAEYAKKLLDANIDGSLEDIKDLVISTFSWDLLTRPEIVYTLFQQESPIRMDEAVFRKGWKSLRNTRYTDPVFLISLLSWLYPDVEELKKELYRGPSPLFMKRLEEKRCRLVSDYSPSLVEIEDEDGNRFIVHPDDIS